MRTVGLRLLFALCGVAAAAAVATIAGIAVVDALERRLGDWLSAAQIAEAVEAALGAVIASAVLALVVILPLSIILADRVRRPMRRLRDEIGRLSRDDWEPPVSRSRIAELRGIARAVEQLDSERRRRIDALGEERDELARILALVNDGILQADGRGRLVRLNPAARALLRLPPDAEGRPLAALLRGPDLRAMVEAAAQGERVPALEVTLDGRTLLAAARPIAPAPETAGVIATFVDITELRRLEGVRRDFVANASHELKTPLTAIRGYAETLVGGDVPEPTQREFLAAIHANSKRLHNIVEDLLDLSRIESGGWVPALAEVGVEPIAREVRDRYADRAAERGVEFTVDSPTVETVETVAVADPFALRQIFANLFSNALRYTPPGGRVAVRVRNGEMLRVEVADTGSGIPGDALPRIFERFYRVDPARSRDDGGTGLGLAIVKHLVERMGGEITAKSTLGRGTTIQFTLPAARTGAAVPHEH